MRTKTLLTTCLLLGTALLLAPTASAERNCMDLGDSVYFADLHKRNGDTVAEARAALEKLDCPDVDAALCRVYFHCRITEDVHASAQFVDAPVSETEQKLWDAPSSFTLGCVNQEFADRLAQEYLADHDLGYGGLLKYLLASGCRLQDSVAVACKYFPTECVY